MNKIKLRLGFLRKHMEFDRNKDQVHALIGGSTKATLTSIEKDLKQGGEIKKPVELAIDLEDNTGLLTDGNHRVTSCINAGMDDSFEIPVLLKILRGRHFMERSRAKKFKKL